MLCVVVLLFSEQGRWDIASYFAQRDYDYITGLRDSFERNPTNQVILDKIIERTENPNPFRRGNAIGVLMQLSGYNTPTGRQIHDQALPVFIRALDEDEQSIKWTGLEGLENLGPFAISAIPDVKQKLSDPDPIIQQEAKETLDKLEEFQTNGPNTVLGSTATAH